MKTAPSQIRVEMGLFADCGISQNTDYDLSVIVFDCVIYKEFVING